MDFIEHVSLEELTEAYFSCRRHKRRKASSLQYELKYEENNLILYHELNSGQYKIGTSNCFCVTKPKLREVFAADFRDRIVHHLLINRLLYIFENNFSEHSYSCRCEKGTLYGVRDVQKQIQKIGKDCWFAQLDIEGFFMSIDKNILWKIVEKMVRAEWKYGDDIEWWLELLKMVIFHRPELNCTKNGNIRLFDMLPDYKTLFKSNGKGLPIGNLTSQIFANAYLNPLDKAISEKCMGYGRYVDDLIMLDTDVEKLKRLIERVRVELKSLGLKLNEKKTRIQRCDKGVLFTGYVIKPWGIYVGNALKKNCMKRSTCTKIPPKKMVLSINSYFGFICHTLGFNLKNRIWKNVSKNYGKLIKLVGNFKCIREIIEPSDVEDIFKN